MMLLVVAAAGLTWALTFPGVGFSPWTNRRGPTAPTATPFHRDGLDKTEAESLLDQLEGCGYTHLTVACSAGGRFTVRAARPA